MKDVKKLIMRVAFGCEILFFLFFYIFGSKGLAAVRIGKQEVIVLHDKMLCLESDKNKLVNQLDDWNNLPFYKERVARNELQMANKNDQIYI